MKRIRGIKSPLLTAALLCCGLSAFAAEPFHSELGKGKVLGLSMKQTVEQMERVLPLFGPGAAMACTRLADLPHLNRTLCTISPIEGVTFAKQRADEMEIVFKDNLLTEVYLRFFVGDKKAQDGTYNAIAHAMDKALPAHERRNDDSYLYFASKKYKSNVHKYVFADGRKFQVTMGYAALD